MSKEAMKLALEALEPRPGMPNPEYESLTQCAITALREALAEQPAQQEPVAYSYTSRITGAQGFSHHPMPRFIDSESWDIQPLYTTPQPAQRKPLTDEQWQSIADTLGCIITRGQKDAIEAAHGIKENT